MNLRLFATLLIALILLGGFFFYRSQTLGLEISIDLQLTVYPTTSHIEGMGSILNNEINCSVIKWPDSGENSINSKLNYLGFPANEATVNVLNFNLLLELNQTEKSIIIPNVEDGTYNVILHCFFGQVAKGNYNLTAILFVEGSNETLSSANVGLQVC
jgi:hypothetical protein